MLFTPFRPGRSWKLGATGYLAMAGVFFMPVHLVFLLFLKHLPFQAGYLATAICFVLAFTAIFAYLFHLCSRLNFAFFDIVLNRAEFVAPAWRRYGPASRRWYLCKILFGCVAVLTLAAPIAAYVRHLIPIFVAQAQHRDQPPSPEFFVAILGGELMVALGFLVFFAISALANDFIVPSLALEDTSLREAFRRLGLLIRHEPGQFALYALLKFAFALVAYMAVNIAFQIAFLFIAAVLALVGGAIGFGLHLLGVSATVLWVFAGVLGIPAMLFVTGYLFFLAAGTVTTFLQAYLLYFLGGRYAMLGDLLDQSTPPRPAPVSLATPRWPPSFNSPVLPPQSP